MRLMRLNPSFESWRAAARQLLQEGVPPQEVLWDDGVSGEALLPALAAEQRAPASDGRLAVSREFVETAEDVALHRDSGRWPLLYSILWRLTHGERQLLRIEVDPEVRRLHLLRHQVSHDRHRMLGFVRFRTIATEDGERYVAWYRPDHRVLRSAAGSFAARFSVMRWSIFTPDESAHWNLRELTFSAGVAAAPAAEDGIEQLWRSYYRASYIPSRANPKAIDRHIPRRYRAAIAEAAEIDDLLRGGPQGGTK
jgi:DNA polymerase